MTVEDLEAMEPDGNRYELIRGVPHAMPATGFRHGKIANRINLPLATHVVTHRLGEVLIAEAGFVLRRNPDIMRVPDIAFVQAARVPDDAEQDRYLRLPPDLVVEVVSPTDRPSDIAEKIADYLAAGGPLIWMAYPQRRVVAIHRPGHPVEELGEDAMLDGGEIVPGFRLPIADIFS
jgi:Uma2 family endonuclease